MSFLEVIILAMVIILFKHNGRKADYPEFHFLVDKTGFGLRILHLHLWPAASFPSCKPFTLQSGGTGRHTSVPGVPWNFPESEIPHSEEGHKEVMLRFYCTASTRILHRAPSRVHSQPVQKRRGKGRRSVRRKDYMEESNLSDFLTCPHPK